MSLESPLPTLKSSRYAIVGRLGSGGMAEVFRAWDRKEKRWCAIKQLRPESATRADSRTRFLRECDTMMDLDHRNVIAAFDVVDRDVPFLVMELADGGSLEEWVDRNGAMPPRMAVDVAIQICKGLGAAHRARVIHRDVKPHNILVDRKGYCKVTDFGIAMIQREDGTHDIPDARLTATKGVLGTLAFMAPEQKTDPRHADVRTDVYGVGATLFTLLSGETRADLFVVVREPELMVGLPEPLIPVVTRAVSYKPATRYDTVADLAKALYDTRGSLPPDPEETPPLVGPIAPDPDPPEDVLPTLMHAGNTPQPVERAGVDVSTPAPLAHPAPTSRNPDPMAALQGAPVTVTPHRLATAEPEPVPERPNMVLRALAVLVVLIGLPTSLDLLWVAQAKRSHDHALGQFLTQLELEVGLTFELAKVGADEQALREAYEVQQVTDQPFARAVLAQRYLTVAEEALEVASNDDEVDEGDLGNARYPLDRLRKSHDAWLEELVRWQVRTETFPGNVVRRMGLSARPPHIKARQ